MVFSVEVLGEVIGQVFLSWVPVYFEELAFHLVTDPKETHLHGSRSLFLDGVICNAGGGFVIAMHWCWWLFVT
jgi:hypothetical protein